MGLHEYSVFARFRYKDLKVGISSGNQALKRCAFLGTNPTGELIPVASGSCPRSLDAKPLSAWRARYQASCARISYNQIAQRSAERLAVLDQFYYAISPRLGRVRASE